MQQIFKKTFGLLLTGILIIFLIACNSNDTPGDETSGNVSPTTYTIQYMDDKGTHKIEVTSGSPYSLEEIPQKNGYEFIGLFDAESGGTQYVNASGSCLSVFTDNQNLILFPQFRAKEYNLILDYQGAVVSGSREIKVAYESKIEELPLNLKLDNNVFVGWFTKPNGEGVQIADKYGVIPGVNRITDSNFDLSNEYGNIYLYAYFKGMEYTVNFYAGNSYVPEEVKVEHGTLISDVIVKTRVNGMAVLTWSKIQNDFNKTQVFNGRVTSDLVLYACEYAPVIDFDTDGGVEISPIIKREGENIILPIPVKENYKFMGWYDNNGFEYNSKIMPEDSLLLKAKWQAMIVFDTKGGTEVDNISLPKGSKVTLPETSKDGYMFAGWYNNGNKYEATAMPEYSVILEAKYYKINIDKIVVISATESYFSTRTTPSIDSSYEIDLTSIYEQGIREVIITAHYKSSYEGCNSKRQGITRMSWFNQNSASEAFKVWEYEEKHLNADYISNTHKSDKIKLNSNKLYVCLYRLHNYYNSDKAYWIDFWIEVEYPDMSTLY